MIRINLLPVREARRKATLRQQLVVLTLTVASTAVGAWFFHISFAGDISGVEQRIAQVKQQLESYKPQQAKVEEFKKKKAEIKAKLEVIDELERSRSGPVRLLDELATHAPERLWLTELKASHGSVEIAGLSLDNELVASFLTSLNNSPFFSNVELESTELKEVQKLKLNSFKIRAKLETPKELDTTAPPSKAPAAAAG